MARDRPGVSPSNTSQQYERLAEFTTQHRLPNIHIRKQLCNVYNLELEGQGRNGHTYYANGILVHNMGRNWWK